MRTIVGFGGALPEGAMSEPLMSYGTCSKDEELRLVAVEVK